MGAPSALDSAVLDRLRALNREGEPDLVAEVLELFLEDSPARLAAVHAAVAAGNTRDLQRAAHGLKGSSGNVGALGMQQLCIELEGLVRQTDGVGGASELAARLDAEFVQVREAAAGLLMR